jgi:hypothetical protein
MDTTTYYRTLYSCPAVLVTYVATSAITAIRKSKPRDVQLSARLCGSLLGPKKQLSNTNHKLGPRSRAFARSFEKNSACFIASRNSKQLRAMLTETRSISIQQRDERSRRFRRLGHRTDINCYRKVLGKELRCRLRYRR